MTKLLKITPLEDSDVLVDLMVETRSRKYSEHREQIRFKVIVDAPDKEGINIERAAYRRLSEIASSETSSPAGLLDLLAIGSSEAMAPPAIPAHVVNACQLCPE